ncbi:putative protein OS=Streptomyces fumanus OX=67302 GN=GCM10018772_35030 PE=4 SV=1 [Streptomyces fumanus]|uniref:Uncharacterized protein n=1 Tax=Streptomyces fumanus TaxID=67302 RepID=A0A919AGA1_9ACTN|nr:hypothetical protein GCM10018772_35030 [Streptomyces fumanus]
MFEEGVRGPRHGAAITQGVKSPGPGLPEFDERFPWFIDPWGKSPGFTCVIGYDDGRPASSTAAHADHPLAHRVVPNWSPSTHSIPPFREVTAPSAS